ncbi:MAG TPA: tyrosine-type recombinase/integrase [Pseudolabrys sp.]|nr:tyrosine-type recombinase/integrase [Pseudolabrys sp.]
MKLTVGRVSGLKLPSGKTDHIAWDDDVPGFGLRLRESGARNFVFQYKLGERHRRMNLGAVSAVTLGEARKTAATLYHRVKLGEEPAGDKADAKIKVAETFAAVTARFLEYKRSRLRPRSYPDVERHLLVHSKALHGLQLAKIERRDIATVIAAVADNSGGVTGNRVRTSLSTFFSWAMMHGLIDSNPVVGTARNREQSRDRVLDPVELRIIWNNLPDDHFGAIMRLLALTGQRANEIAALRWSEIRDDVIVLPSDRTKNHRAHIVPLNAPTRAIIEAQPRRTNAAGRPRDLIFGHGEGPFSGWSNAKEKLDQQITKAAGKPLPHWTPHDLRRTAATMMAEVGVQPHVIEAVLNHVSGHRAGVAGIYNRASYEREKAAALDLWGGRLMTIVGG